MRPRDEHNLGVFLRMPGQNTRIEADFRPRRARRLVQRDRRCSVDHVVAALPQGAETFRLIRYPSPLGGSAPMFSVRRPPIFYSKTPDAHTGQAPVRVVLMKRT